MDLALLRALGDDGVVAALRAGDETAFVALVRRHHGQMVRLARCYVPTAAIAEEVAQDAWLGVLRGLPGFEGRSSLRSWIFRIVVYRARTRREREPRAVPLSALETEPSEHSAVEPGRFLPRDHPRWPGHWSEPPRATGADPERGALDGELRRLVHEEIERLPPSQAVVVRLRDVLGWTSDEVWEALAISAANQRVLLHRARSRLRGRLEEYLRAVPGRPTTWPAANSWSS